MRAKHLLSEGDGRFRLARGKRGVTYHHLLLPRHALIFANGALSESLYPGRFALSGFDDAAKAELFDLFPAFADVLTDADPSALYGATALPFARRRDVAALLTL